MYKLGRVAFGRIMFNLFKWYNSNWILKMVLHLQHQMR
jgi:hypothetical protein